jgi:hypothetical protein
MYQITTDDEHSIINFTLSGAVSVTEIEKFVEQLQRVTISYAGREIKIMADLQHFKPTSSEVAQRIQEVQEFGLKSGVARVAEIVGSHAVAVQLNVVARRSGTANMLRRFADVDEAKAWLISGVVPKSAEAQEKAAAKAQG